MCYSLPQRNMKTPNLRLCTGSPPPECGYAQAAGAFIQVQFSSRPPFFFNQDGLPGRSRFPPGKGLTPSMRQAAAQFRQKALNSTFHWPEIPLSNRPIFTAAPSALMVKVSSSVAYTGSQMLDKLAPLTGNRAMPLK